MSDLALLLGEAPSKSGDRYYMFPLSGAVGERLCHLADIPPDAEGSRYGRWYWALRERFDCLNLIERYPGSQGSGAAFPMDLADEWYRRRRDEGEFSGRVIVCLGRRVPRAFGWEDGLLPFYGWARMGGGVLGGEPGWLVAIPHPSGLNRLYNEHQHHQWAGEVLREAEVLVQEDVEGWRKICAGGTRG